MRKFISKCLLLLEPIIKWIDKVFTVPFSIKKVTGDHYYQWRNQINPGSVFLTQIFGVGSNLINPSEVNHSAIYFGRGLRSAIDARIEHLNASSNNEDFEMAKRLENIIVKHGVKDEVCYVIEGVGGGVIPTNLVKFLTTKDIVLVVDPVFTDDHGRRNACIKAIDDLGLPYDFAFSDRDNAKYCFEVVADAYERALPGIKLKRKIFKFLGIELYNSFLADTFLDDAKWHCIIDSRKQ